MKRQLERFLMTTMLVCLVLTVALAMTACNEKTARAFRDSAIVINTSAKTIATLHDEGFISNESYPDIVRAQIEVTQIHKEAIALFRALDTITPENKGAALLKVDALLTSLERLQQKGLLHIKDPTRQTVFLSAISGLRINVGIIRAFIEDVRRPVKIPNSA